VCGELADVKILTNLGESVKAYDASLSVDPEKTRHETSIDIDEFREVFC